MNFKNAVVCTVLILIMGCKEQTGNGIQLARLPGVAPVVIANPSTGGEFFFTVTVRNFGSEVSPAAYLRVLVKWIPGLDCGSLFTTQKEKIYPIKSLQPNEPWTINSEMVAALTNDTSCHCNQGACAGTIYFTLLKDDFPFVAFLYEKNTSLKLEWSADGNSNNIVDLNGSIPQ